MVQHQTPDFNKAQSEAEKLINQFEFTSAPIDPEQIAEGLGVDVLYAHFKPEVSKKLSGLIDINNNRIIINKDIHPNRMIFTIAHELGHYIMHKDYAASNEYKTLPRHDNYAENAKPAVEREADAFAANLLMPAKLVRKYKDFATVSELAKMFCVSEQAMRYRLNRV